MLYDDTVILLFAKAPVEGTVNTRLIPDIGVDAATRLQEELIEQRLKMLSDADLCPVELLCAPDSQHEYFLHCQQRYRVVLQNQVGESLGQRMFNASKKALKNYKCCLLIGTDAPALDGQQIAEAVTELHSNKDVVFVPAEDGGYVLLAMRQAYSFLFEGISWGTSEVMSQTRNRLLANNLSFVELAKSWDIDRYEDYQRYLATGSV